jgi:hypothetical protein
MLPSGVCIRSGVVVGTRLMTCVSGVTKCAVLPESRMTFDEVGDIVLGGPINCKVGLITVSFTNVLL